MLAAESGDLETVDRDILFKNIKFNQIKDFEEIALSNIDKYKALKHLEDK